MERRYHIEKENTEAASGFLSKNGQALLPLVEQIEQAEVALDELIDVLGRATVEMVLRWAAAALLMTEQNFRRIMGYRNLWMLKASLDQKRVLIQQEVA